LKIICINITANKTKFNTNDNAEFRSPGTSKFSLGPPSALTALPPFDKPSPMYHKIKNVD
jgi:hypothetical protein